MVLWQNSMETETTSEGISLRHQELGVEESNKGMMEIHRNLPQSLPFSP